MICFIFILPDYFLLVYARYYTIVAYALCDVVLLYQYAYGTIYSFYTVVTYDICVMASVGR